MPKIQFIEIVASASGKLCEHSNVAFATNRKSGKSYTVTRHPERYAFEPTAAQQAHMLAFGAQAKTASAWIKANTTYDEKGKPSSRTADYLLMKRAYDQQNRINGFSAFVRAQIDPESGEIVVPGKGE